LSGGMRRRDFLRARFLRGHGVEVLFGAWFPIRYPSIATLAWIPDFQHVHLPDMFSDAERAARERNFAETGRLSTRVVLLSRGVESDFRARLPQHARNHPILSPLPTAHPHL